MPACLSSLSSFSFCLVWFGLVWFGLVWFGLVSGSDAYRAFCSHRGKPLTLLLLWFFKVLLEFGKLHACMQDKPINAIRQNQVWVRVESLPKQHEHLVVLLVWDALVVKVILDFLPFPRCLLSPPQSSSYQPPCQQGCDFNMFNRRVVCLCDARYDWATNLCFERSWITFCRAR